MSADDEGCCADANAAAAETDMAQAAKQIATRIRVTIGFLFADGRYAASGALRRQCCDDV
ncbi:hypothetical protein RSO01_47700 [Reyranella soli]|uniref:Uncharacterized protein n=1 Tax=Reyranella soli TaxID=1230389 RepID=A0A512NF87_9HYPH|nr:hypothetical protein RSO01_47700 [Reyranella soli]